MIQENIKKMKNVFDKENVVEIINRIKKLDSNSKQRWSKMNVAQMLAHCNVSYEMVYTDIHPKPNIFVKFILKSFIKNKVVNTAPYKNNGRTAPQFLMKETKNFHEEKKRLIKYKKKTQELGTGYFNNKESHSFGKLTTTEWNNMFYKHLNHHLSQFEV